MPAKEKSHHAQKQSSNNDSVTSISVSEVKIKNFSVEPIIEANQLKESPQYITYPRYDYGNKKTDGKGESKLEKFVFTTEPIKIAKGGIPKIHQKWRKTDNDCMNFWLNLDQDDNGKELMKVLEQLDAYCSKKINDDKNNDFIVKINEGGKRVTIKDLKYLPSVKMSVLDSNDEDEEKTSNGLNEQYKRIKVKLWVDYNKDADPTDPKKIRTKVITNDKDGNMKYEDVESLDDFRKHFTWGCTAQFQLEINKFWVMKQKDTDGIKKCGLGVKCLQVYVTEKSEFTKQSTQLTMSVFGNKSKNESTKGKSDDSDSSESESDSESENETNVKAKTNTNTKTKESQSNSDESGSESEPEEKPVKGKNKTVAKAKNESDDESNNDSDSNSDSNSDSEDTPKGKEKVDTKKKVQKGK